jgi:hypothetical protein
VVQVEFVIPERAAAKSQRWPLVPPQAMPRASDSLHLKITANGLHLPRAGQHGAIGADVIALMYALKIPIAVLAGFNWGGRAACVAAALWPERCTA